MAENYTVFVSVCGRLCSNDVRTTFGENAATESNYDGEIGCDEMLIHEPDPLRNENGSKTATRFNI